MLLSCFVSSRKAQGFLFCPRLVGFSKSMGNSHSHRTDDADVWWPRGSETNTLDKLGQKKMFRKDPFVCPKEGISPNQCYSGEGINKTIKSCSIGRGLDSYKLEAGRFLVMSNKQWDDCFFIQNEEQRSLAEGWTRKKIGESRVSLCFFGGLGWLKFWRLVDVFILWYKLWLALHVQYLPWNQHGTQKLKVGRCWRVLSFWEGLLSGAMLVLGSVDSKFEMFQRFFVEFVHWSLDIMCILFVLLGHLLKTYRRWPFRKNIPPIQVSEHPKMKQDIRKNEKIQTIF